MNPRDTPQLLEAAWIAPMDAPLLREGAVAFQNGRILAVGTSKNLRRTYPEAIRQELGNVVLLPGLVNAHLHLELSDCQCGAPPAGGFGAWLLQLVRRNAIALPQLEGTIQSAVKMGVDQCLRFGVTSVGDISRQTAITRPLLQHGPLRVTSYGEIQAMAARRNLFADRFDIATDMTFASDRLRIGLSPHAPYTVEPFAYTACRLTAEKNHLPLATHLAESPDETDFLKNHTGPFRELWEAIGQWDDEVPYCSGGPIRFAASLGLIDFPTLLAHVNYCDDDELSILAAGKASIVYCPRTHRYFGHPPHRWREMLTRGINVALGTDSCASSPNLNLVDDARLVYGLAPELPVEQIWEMVTIRGAKAIDAERLVGSITPGKCADFVAFPVESEDPLKEILESPTLPSRTWIAGEKINSSHGDGGF